MTGMVGLMGMRPLTEWRHEDRSATCRYKLGSLYVRRRLDLRSGVTAQTYHPLWEIRLMTTNAIRTNRHVNAPRASVYRALVDAHAVATWMVPSGMTSQVQVFDGREGGLFRITFTYDAPTATPQDDRAH